MHFYEKKLPTFTNKLKQNILWKFKHNIDKIENTRVQEIGGQQNFGDGTCGGI